MSVRPREIITNLSACMHNHLAFEQQEKMGRLLVLDDADLNGSAAIPLVKAVGPYS
jgi:hypothetical protein